MPGRSSYVPGRGYSANMTKRSLLFLVFLVLVLIAAATLLVRFPFPSKEYSPRSQEINGTIDLPEPLQTGTVSVEEALAHRRSIRFYAERPLTRSEIAQLLWAAQGITGIGGKRTAPSAGALYPLEIYCVIGEVEGISSGVYQYLPSSHQLQLILAGDVRGALYEAALNQSPVREAPVSLLITGIYQRTTAKYGERGERYVHLEAGHAAQNVYLQAESLNLGTVAIGAFEDERIKEILALEEGEMPLYIMPVGGR
jgi:SagB-type dehydrogenase family enzyme